MNVVEGPLVETWKTTVQCQGCHAKLEINASDLFKVYGFFSTKIAFKCPVETCKSTVIVPRHIKIPLFGKFPTVPKNIVKNLPGQDQWETERAL